MEPSSSEAVESHSPAAPARGADRDLDRDLDDGSDDAPMFFGTETMAELCVRQGQIAEAIAIYARLLTDDPPADRRARWADRLATLNRAGGSAEKPRAAPLPARKAPTSAAALALEAPRSSDAAQPEPSPPGPLAPRAVPALIVRQAVRSGQVVYAEHTDLIVLGAVNPGAQLVADGNIHVYGPMRGRAIAGARGFQDAHVFCQRLEAELVAIGGAHVTCEEIPHARFGKPTQIFVEDGRCVLAPL